MRRISALSLAITIAVSISGCAWAGSVIAGNLGSDPLGIKGPFVANYEYCILTFTIETCFSETVAMFFRAFRRIRGM